jgi:uncharacterized membrane protein YidH (DUF202 family)
MARSTEKSGLQPERTQLSWERTSIGFLAIGALVLLRNGELQFGGRAAAAAIAFGLAVAVVVVGGFGARRMMTSPALVVVTIGWATLGLAAVVIGLIVFSG